jgi:superfamily II helicase
VAIHEKYPMLAASGDSVITIYTLLIDDQERARPLHAGLASVPRNRTERPQASGEIQGSATAAA